MQAQDFNNKIARIGACAVGGSDSASGSDSSKCHASAALNLEGFGKQWQKLSAVSDQLHTELHNQLRNEQERADELEQVSLRLERQRDHLLEENCSLNEERSRAVQSLNITKENCETLADQVRLLHDVLLKANADKKQLEQDNVSVCAKLHSSETTVADLLKEKAALCTHLEAQEFAYNIKLNDMKSEISRLTAEKVDLQSKASEVADNMQQLEQLHKSFLIEKGQFMQKIEFIIADSKKRLSERLLDNLKKDDELKILTSEIVHLNNSISAKEELFVLLQNEKLELEAKYQSLVCDREQLFAEVEYLRRLRPHLILADKMIKEQEAKNLQSNFEIQLLEAKHRDAKQRLTDQAEAHEQLLNDIRWQHENEILLITLKNLPKPRPWRQRAKRFVLFTTLLFFLQIFLGYALNYSVKDISLERVGLHNAWY